jgi:hypothetical protein
MFMQELEDLIDEHCREIDEFAKVELTPGTPIHTFQQSMIANVKRYRAAKLKDEHDSDIPFLQPVERGASEVSF